MARSRAAARLPYASRVILLIDNYDSFTWNLVQRLGEIDPSLDADRDLLVVRNDRITPDEVERLDDGRGPTHILISPGPCTPSEAGVSGAIIARFAGRVPILGVCLGHQCIAAGGGMPVVRHTRPMHGKTSQIHHDGKGIFAGIPSPFTAARYHSLIVPAMSIPARREGEDGWEVSAWTDEEVSEPAGAPPNTMRIVMGLRRVWKDAGKAPLEGVQFHPESFMTEQGVGILAKFIGAVRASPVA